MESNEFTNKVQVIAKVKDRKNRENTKVNSPIEDFLHPEGKLEFMRRHFAGQVLGQEVIHDTQTLTLETRHENIYYNITLFYAINHNIISH